jgi:hypothetical protein
MNTVSKQLRVLNKEQQRIYYKVRKYRGDIRQEWTDPVQLAIAEDRYKKHLLSIEMFKQQLEVKISKPLYEGLKPISVMRDDLREYLNTMNFNWQTVIRYHGKRMGEDTADRLIKHISYRNCVSLAFGALECDSPTENHLHILWRGAKLDADDISRTTHTKKEHIKKVLPVKGSAGYFTKDTYNNLSHHTIYSNAKK